MNYLTSFPEKKAKYSPSGFRCSDLAGIFLFNVLVFQPIIEVFLPIFSYFDELFALACVAFLVYSILRGCAIPTKCWGLMVLLALMICTGLVGNALSGLPSRPLSIFVDILASSKFIIVFLAFKLGLFYSSDNIIRYLDIEARIMLTVAFVCLLINQVGDLGMTYEERYGLKAFQFIYIHPSHLVTMSLACLMIICANSKSNWRLFAVMALVLMMASLRSRWIALAIIATVIIFAGSRRLKQFFIPICIGSVGIAFALGASQMAVYYGNDSPAARNQLANASLDIFFDYFPFGTGFGTFGTGITKTDYSELYYQYGFSDIPGLSPEFPSYITDTFWPAVLAEFGLIGFFVWSVLLCLMFFEFYSRGERSGTTPLALLFIATLLIASTSSGAIFSMQMITLLFVFMLITGRQLCERGA